MFPPDFEQKLLQNQHGMLIVDLIAGARPVKEILERHHLSEEELKKRLRDPLFKTMYKEVKKFWNSDMNVHERIRFKSAMLVEEALPVIFRIMTGELSGDSSKLEAFKQLSAQGKPKDLGAQQGLQFNLTIVKGSDPAAKVEIHGRRIIDAEVQPAQLE